LPKIFIDADGCAVKDEVYKCAERYQLSVILVANKALKIPFDQRIVMQVVSGGFDAADDWIFENIVTGDIVITADIVLGPKGKEFTEDNVGSAVATRELMTHLRQIGDMRGGPAPMEKKDRSVFLGKLDQIIQALKKAGL
jgi:uncharacterized protein YaiI (UPF0178 family)